ncbi:MAG: hypothetical protein OXC26_17455 [Albidovulum sp.]|nr:hypothetical protein [Albidovulum sp.]
MNEERLLVLEGQIAALELIVPMAAAYLTEFNKDIRKRLITDLELIAGSHEFPPDRNPVFVEAFTGLFDKVATNLRRSP